jgi:archaellum component FlaG (FlaF/FlaG flagellin family)
MKDGMNKGKSRKIIIFVAVILILAAVLLYVLVIRPSISGYAVKVQSSEDIRMLNAIVATVNQNGYVQIPVVGTNQSFTLVPYQLCGQIVAAANAAASNLTNATK